MKKCLLATTAALTLAAPAAAAPIDWTKAGAVSAILTAPIWNHTPATTSGLRVTTITAITPYGKTRLYHNQLRAQRWTVTASWALDGKPLYTDRFCVKAFGPVHQTAPFTRFGISGWSPGSLRGGCNHYDGTPYPMNAGSAFDWGGSISWP